MLLSALFCTALATVIPAGSLEGEVEGRPVALPALKTDVVAHLDGDLATVKLTQTFANETGQPMHARYVFPLPEDAAVTAMTLKTPSAEIEARIEKRAKATQIFETAKAEGKKAALLDQERPNVFQQQVANLGPGEKVSVTLTYAHAVPRRDGEYRWQLPLVVGPRYVPSDAAASPDPLGTWTVKSTDRLPNPDHIDRDRVSVVVHMDGGVPIQSVDSPSHELSVKGSGARRTVTLAGGRVLDNKDLRLDYRLASDDVAVGVTTYADAGRGIVSLLVEPPAAVQAENLTPREMVFVLDTSCSMSGIPMEASKHFMREAIADLRPSDMLRMVRFDTAASEWSSRGEPVNAETVRSALAWVDGLGGRGGTDVSAGIRTALKPPVQDGRLRIVVFLSDGYIGNEAHVLGELRSQRGEARIFAFGIGNAVNRYLVEEMAREGRGVARIVGTVGRGGRGGGLDAQEATEAAAQLAERLEAAVLTDVSIDWGTAAVRDTTPTVLPDLFAGEPLRVMARFDAPGVHEVTVRGRIAGRAATLPLKVTLPKEAAAHTALPNLWARSQVEDRMIDLLDPTATATARQTLQDQVTTLGLEYGLVTQWTSFVAVAPDAPLPSAQDTKTADVATPPPAGVSPKAYGGPTFGGGAAPEPATWLGGLLLVSMAGGSLWGRRRRDEASR
ncbi:MAG: VWA domain-containing protein [Myxococcales bacterium]|nr:VWA domain-containing protein [Myxococcales bacterium]